MITTTLIYIFSITAFASFLQTITGFGYALAAAPLLAFFMEPKDAVMLVLATGLVTKMMLLTGVKLEGKFSDILPVFLASLAGALPGAYIITFISADALKAFIGVTLLITTYFMSANYTVDVKRPRLAQRVIGMISGFLGATTSLSGPPLVLYYLNENAEKDRFRANLTRYFLLGNLSTLIISYGFGTLQPATLFLPIVVSIPALAFGVWIGEKLFNRLNPQVFRRLAIGVISISGIMTAYNGLSRFLQ